jgi:hypothetical protein
MIEIAFLANYPEAIPTLTSWFRSQWPEYYAARNILECLGWQLIREIVHSDEQLLFYCCELAERGSTAATL